MTLSPQALLSTNIQSNNFEIHSIIFKKSGNGLIAYLHSLYRSNSFTSRCKLPHHLIEFSYQLLTILQITTCNQICPSPYQDNFFVSEHREASSTTTTPKGQLFLPAPLPSPPHRPSPLQLYYVCGGSHAGDGFCLRTSKIVVWMLAGALLYHGQLNISINFRPWSFIQCAANPHVLSPFQLSEKEYSVRKWDYATSTSI